jgi:hypothetical protein
VTEFRLDSDLPREGFVQRAIERHFASCARAEAGHADFACTDERGRRWLVEAKGETSDVGLDLRTGLGQLLQGASEPGWTLALAMPDTPKFERQRSRTPDWVRQALGLHWLVVRRDGRVAVVSPKEP